MNYYFAPMEGITRYIYRNQHNHFYPGIDKYFTPFIVANQTRKLKTREINDILPENNTGCNIVPQILTNNAEDFIHTALHLRQFGYQEINLNLGCPAGTVVAKGKGAGFLAYRDKLDEFLDKIYSADVGRISIKTRLGKEQPEEFYELIPIFNKYPMEELIIHPRVQKDMYKNHPNLTVFSDAIRLSKAPVCYNGDLFTVKDYEKFHQSFPSIKCVMLGRGLLSNPSLVNEIKGGERTDKKTLREFHDSLCVEYTNILSGDRDVLFKMKELWTYLITIFTNYEEYQKKIRKSNTLAEYKIIIDQMFKNEEVV